MKYIKQLDSVRAIAALLVVVWHWMPGNRFVNPIDNGALGVNIFFVLSGFLITGILIDNRNKSKGENKISHVFKNFYVRRALRIFPIYFLTIFFIIFLHRYLGAKLGKAELINSLTYTINFYFFLIKNWGDLTVHFWSLAVEEQFYLLWPFVILLVRKKNLLPVIFFFIAAGIISQCFIQNKEFGYLPTYSCFDAFGLGALLAWIVMYRINLLPQIFKILRIFAIVSIIILLIQIKYGQINHLPQRTLHSSIAAWIISYLVLKNKQPHFRFSFVFNNPILLFLGKISYGIYLYHVLIQWFGFKISGWLMNKFSSTFIQHNLMAITLVINFCLLILIAWLSWIVIEKPILGMKKYFEYNISDKNKMTVQEL